MRATISTGAAMTTEVLRDLQIAHWIVLALLRSSDEGPVIPKLENPDGREPWGDHSRCCGRARVDRSSAAVYGSFLPARLRRVSHNSTKAVQESLQLPRSTASRERDRCSTRGGLLGAL